MKRKLFSLGIIFTLAQMNAQTYQKLSLSGFNADVIANGTGAATSSTTASLDKASDNFAYMSQDFKVNSSDPALTYGLPVNGSITSPNTNGLSYQLPSYSGNNSLRLPNSNNSGILTVATPVAASMIYVLAVSGSGPSTGEITVSFQGGTTQVFTNVDFQDWYDGGNFEIQGIGRINRASNSLDSGGGINPRIYQIPLSVSTANQTKLITSVTFKKTSTDDAVMNIFAISVQSIQLSVSDVKKAKENKMYPNPFSNELNISDISDIVSIDVLDTSGRAVKQNLQPDTKLNFSFLDKGTYIFVLKNKNGTSSSQKLIKK